MPKITEEMIDDAIVRVQYHVFPGTQLTICCIHMRNGWTVTGESVALNPAAFDARMGEKVSFHKARDKVATFLNYSMKERMASAKMPEQARENVGEFQMHDQVREIDGAEFGIVRPIKQGAEFIEPDFNN